MLFIDHCYEVDLRREARVTKRLTKVNPPIFSLVNSYTVFSLKFTSSAFTKEKY